MIDYIISYIDFSAG